MLGSMAGSKRTVSGERSNPAQDSVRRRGSVPCAVWLAMGAGMMATLCGGPAISQSRASLSASLPEARSDTPPPLAVRPTFEEILGTTEPGVPSPSFEDQVLEIVNQERWTNGMLAPLKGNAELATAAEGHSQAMAERNFFSHCDLDTGTLPSQRTAAAGYVGNGSAENAAAGQSTPVSVMATWMGSTGHRNNILSTSRRELGIGYFFQGGDQNNVRLDLVDPTCVHESLGGPYGHYWTQNFGFRSTSDSDPNVYPVVIDREAFATTSRSVDLYVYGSSWASEMRIRNAGGVWTNWMPHATDTSWQLSSGNGLKTVEVELRNAAMQVLTSLDSIHLDAPISDLFDDGFELGLSSWDVVHPTP